ncbi:hypothetical protein D3C71_1585970 [compost metagenome]
MRDDRQTYLLAQPLVGHAEGGSLLHARMAMGVLFDVCRMDVVATTDDEVLLAAHNLKVSAFIKTPQITTEKPAAAVERGFRGRLVVEVAQHQQAAAPSDFADLAGEGFHVRVVGLP